MPQDRPCRIATGATVGRSSVPPSRHGPHELRARSRGEPTFAMNGDDDDDDACLHVHDNVRGAHRIVDPDGDSRNCGRKAV